jgi:hypothetical protein
MTFCEDWGWGGARDEVRKIYDANREAGGNFIDMANIYTNDSSEKLVGDSLPAIGRRCWPRNTPTLRRARPGTDANAEATSARTGSKKSRPA